jgi:uncharacterized protein YidB (DUF937 family)
MGFLSNILKGLGGGGSTQGNQSALFDALAEMISNPQSGGLQGLLQTFQQKGLGDIFSSWISTGQNQTVSPSQVKHALGGEQIQQLAEKAGLSVGEVSQAVSKMLPEIVNKLTPNGNIEAGGLVDEGLSALKKLLG